MKRNAESVERFHHEDEASRLSKFISRPTSVAAAPMTAKLYAESWQDARRPDPSPERLKFEAASYRQAKAGKQMREWLLTKPGIGREYEAIVAAWVDAQTAADAAFDEMIASELTARAGAAE